MPTNARYDIYLSSTLKDMEDERKAVLEVLNNAAFGVKQSYSSSENSLTESCLDDVSTCRVYVGVIGMRYGYCPPNTDGAAQEKSITQLEYECARKNNIPCFIFIKSEDANYKPNYLDTHTKENGAGDAIAKFRDRLNSGSEVRPDTFEETTQLREKVTAKIAELRGYVEGGQALMQSRRRNIAELTHDVGAIGYYRD